MVQRLEAVSKQTINILLINTCDEQGAGFAADAYARVGGLAVVCITYCVGGLKVANTTAQAFAEKSPVVVISGAPGTDERMKSFSILDVQIDPQDRSLALQRLTDALGKRVKR